MHYLSSKEKIKLAIDSLGAYLKEQKIMNPMVGKLKIIETSIPYKDAEDFLAKNPDCCSLKYDQKKYGGDGVRPRELFKMLFGQDAGTVYIKYKRNYLDENNVTQSEIRSTSVNLNVCGKVIYNH